MRGQFARKRTLSEIATAPLLMQIFENRTGQSVINALAPSVPVVYLSDHVA